MLRRWIVAAFLVVAALGCAEPGGVTADADASADADSVDGDARDEVAPDVPDAPDADGVEDVDDADGGDGGDGGDGDVDGDVDDADDGDGALGRLGDPCARHADCVAGYCTETPEGDRVCSGACTGSCPPPYESWECRALRTGASTIVMLCLPPSDLLCAACFRDDQCESLRDLCLDYPIGRFCARDCSVEECPAGYDCVDVESGGETYRQCRASSGNCADCYDADGDLRGVGDDCVGPDCDDADANRYDDSEERIDLVDNDCDGLTDEGTTAYDDDGDGFCEVAPCTLGASGGGDCDDASPTTRPGAAEDGGTGTDLANGVDDDCDGTTDEGTLNYDDDYDGYCELDPCVFGIFGDGDCEDSDVARHPGAAELPNGVDDDCDGTTDEATGSYDDDGDGYCEIAPCTTGSLGGGDCNDAEPAVNPGAAEVRNGTDDDCDGAIDEGTTAYDDDGDGYCELGPCIRGALGEGDCNDDNSLVHPGAAEARNGVDDDCDGTTDEGTTAYDDDGDGYCEVAPCVNAPAGGDCDDTNPLRSPGRTEVADGVDNDCDGATDEGTAVYDDDGDGFCEVGPCVNAPAGGDCDDTRPTVYPSAPEDGGTGTGAPDGRDNDCDGTTDEGTTAYDDDGDGFCEVGPCIGTGVLPGDCADANPARSPGRPELCGNSVDDDCDGRTDVVDNDGDGAPDAACGGTDCDDSNPAVLPGAAEIRDALDNDCDGTYDDGLIVAGDVVVVEMMKDPRTPVSDTYGEWLEVRNVSAWPINLQGWVVRDDGTDTHTISRTGGLRIESGGVAVLARNGDPALNGGITPDYVYANFVLAQTTGDEVVLVFDGAVVDRVDYLTSGGWPNTEGSAMNLTATLADAASNDSPANWCNAPAGFEYYTANRGTPGAANVVCAGGPAFGRVVPGRGISAGGETVVVEGNRLTGATSVTFGGAAAAFTVVDDRTIRATTPAGTPGAVDVRVVAPGGSFTLARGFTYTGTASTLDFCNVQYPESTTTSVGTPTVLIFGRVRETGVTPPAGQGAGILAELGWGPGASDPRTTPGWTWSSAAYYMDVGSDDAYGRSLTIGSAGTRSYAYRFSIDGGVQWLYCDVGAGTSDGFSTTDLGTLTVL